MDRVLSSNFITPLVRTTGHFFRLLSLKKSKPTISAETLLKLENAIKESENLHSAQICIALESSLPFKSIWKGLSKRDRALEVFVDMRVWDTEQNNGILIYILLSEKKVEIVGDRGFSRKIPKDSWISISQFAERYLVNGDLEKCVLSTITGITTLVSGLFEPSKNQINELPDKPKVF
jgi:hypothetical protein